MPYLPCSVVYLIKRIQGVYRVFRGVLGCIYGVYSYITGVNKCVTYGNEGVYRVYYDGFT